MTESELKARTKRFALEVIQFVDTLPRERVCDHIGRQLLRSGTSVGANYRSACRAKSGADMAAKLTICEEEADESGYWLELLVESQRSQPEQISELLSESDQMVAILVASRKTIKASISKGLLKESRATYGDHSSGKESIYDLDLGDAPAQHGGDFRKSKIENQKSQ